jgi:HNH endonuclease
MRYKLHRVAPNSDGWLRPSIGRLGQTGVGDYVNKHGFGHEDWNFNFELTVDGQMLGYTVATPAQEHIGESFGLILATYDAGGWRATGFYDGALFLDASSLPVPESTIKRMAADVYQLAEVGQTSAEYRDMTLSQIEASIRKDFVYFRWSIPTEGIHVFRQPLPIPKNVFDPGKQRMVTSFNLTKEQFRTIAKLGNDIANNKVDREADEGSEILRLHKKRERNAKLVTEFKASLISFECSVCGFDFSKKYGPLGAGYVECHHTKPVAKMKPGDKTRLSDLCAVCANCHRMIHKSQPMLSPEQLRNLIQSKIGLK